MRLVTTAVLLLAVTSQTAAQQSDQWRRFLPHVHYFEALIADPNEPHMGLGLMQTNVFARAGAGAERQPFTFPDPEDAAHDVDVTAAIGGSLPLWHFAEWPGKGGIVASAQLGVFSRFRIEYPTREDVGQDWFVGMPIEVAYDKFSGRFRIMHRSSHIGDELVETTGAQRIEFGGEYADFLAAYNVTPVTRFYGGATWNFRSYTKRLPVMLALGRNDAFQLQAGVDAGWYPWSRGRTGLVGGFDWQSAERTGWRSGFAVAAGFAARTHTRATRLLLRYFHGPSPMGEFFLTPETYWTVEWVVDF